MITRRRAEDSHLSACLTLFASVGTLVCCALPALLVLLGLGAAVASTLSVAPWLAALTRHKELVFALAGVVIGGNARYVFRVAPRLRVDGTGCRSGDDGPCVAASRFGRLTVVISAVIYLTGFAVAFLLGPLLTWVDR